MTEPPVDQLITVARAIAILDAVDVSPRVVRRLIDDPLIDDAILAEDVFADRDYPPFDRSLMDGYAVRGTGPAFDVIGDVPAGQSWSRPLAADQCVSIMTGAPVPTDADAVVPIESTQRTGNRITVAGVIKPAQAISRRGSDIAKGAALLSKGDRITPAAIGVLATVGRVEVQFYARPRVGVLSTGDEIVPAHQSPAANQIRNANAPMLRALLRQLGCEGIDCGHAPDDPAAIESALRGAEVDAVFVTGGMSMGAYDYVPSVLQKLSYTLSITKLKIKPGKPFVFAAAADLPMVFGLPGNPVSGFVCTVVLAARVLRRMAGATAEPKQVIAPLTHALPANGPRDFYQPAIFQNGLLTPLNWKGSADLFTLARANALIARVENDPPQYAGAAVTAILLSPT